MHTLEEILQKLQPECLKYTRITEESFASEVYLIDTNVDQKILKLAHSEIKYWRESKSLDFLRNHILVPSIVESYDPGPKFNGAILMNRLSGRPLSFATLNSSIVRACGELLAKLHLIPTEGLGYFQKDGFEKVPFENWWSYRRDMVLGPWTKAIENRVDEKTLKHIHGIFERYYDGFEENPTCYIHCDFRFGNILVDNDKICGLIDFESSRTGDPAYDFIKIHEAIGAQQDLWECFLSGYSKLRPLPDLQKTIPYYELDLNYGFLQWAVLRGEENLFQQRLTKLLALIDKQ